MSRVTMRNPTAPRILITRLSAIGDCIHTMPLVSALRQHLPNCHITWVTQPGPATLLADYPGLDQTVVIRRGWIKSPSRILRLQRELQALKIDVAIDPQSLTKSSLLAWLSGAPHRIGFRSPQGRELSLWLNNERITPCRDHVVDRYLELLRPIVGDQELVPEFDLKTPSSAKLDSFLRETHLHNGFAVVNPGAGWPSKLWIPSRFGRVARHLGEAHELPTVVVWSGNDELIHAKEIVARSGGHAWLAPETSLPELATLMKRAVMCVASDTGPLHLAAAVNTPCVGLYGPTLPRHSGPYGPAHVNVQAYYHAGTSRERRNANNDAMRAIESSAVCDACDLVLRRLHDAHAA